MEVLESMNAKEHEQVVFSRDRATGLRSIIAVHNTRLGPGLGGIRIRAYPSEAAALEDALRLSQAMTYKNACAGLAFGGAKAVILGPLPADRRAAFLAMGRVVEGLAGRYVATEDMGMTEPDIAVLNEITRPA
ncbi:MAG: leucine dehydrogenase, partial [Salinisphaera sp.]|nr:leucine dehydrogenase [Salinisphaera sp.]